MKEITVVTRQRYGALAEFTEVLAAAGVNIETLDAETVGDSAIFILTVDQYDVALKALARTSFQAVSEDAIVIRLEDTPGALAHVLRRFQEAKIGLSGARIIRRDGDASSHRHRGAEEIR